MPFFLTKKLVKYYSFIYNNLTLNKTIEKVNNMNVTTKKLKLVDVRFELPFQMNKGICLGYLKSIRQSMFDFDVLLPTKGKNLQRKLVWSLDQKSELILSILKGIKIPPMALMQVDLNTSESFYKVIDGKQRLNALFEFIDNRFPVIYEGESYYYDDLDHQAQRVIALYNIIADVVYDDDVMPQTEKDVWLIKWFTQINFTGTPQEKQHLEYLTQD